MFTNYKINRLHKQHTTCLAKMRALSNRAKDRQFSYQERAEYFLWMDKSVTVQKEIARLVNQQATKHYCRSTILS